MFIRSGGIDALPTASRDRSWFAGLVNPNDHIIFDPTEFDRRLDTIATHRTQGHEFEIGQFSDDRWYCDPADLSYSPTVWATRAEALNYADLTVEMNRVRITNLS